MKSWIAEKENEWIKRPIWKKMSNIGCKTHREQHQLWDFKGHGRQSEVYHMYKWNCRKRKIEWMRLR